MDVDDRRTAQTVELLQQLIRNECVNDGTVESGDEVRNSDLLQTYLEGAVSTSRPSSQPPAAVHGGEDRRVRPNGPSGLPHGPHRRGARVARRLAPRPLRRRADRRRSLGSGRGRHAQPHCIDGRRLQAPGRVRHRGPRAISSTSASPTRKPGASGGRGGSPTTTGMPSGATTSSPSSEASPQKRRRDTPSPSTSPRRGWAGSGSMSRARPVTARRRTRATTRWSAPPRWFVDSASTGRRRRSTTSGRFKSTTFPYDDDIKHALLDPARLDAALDDLPDRRKAAACTLLATRRSVPT